MKKLIAAAVLFPVAACMSGSSGSWSASSWNGLAPQNVYAGGLQYYAAPAEGQGFKLKFTLKTDGNFGIASGEAPTDAELEAAAKTATPDGCTFVSVQRTPDGGALADYNCD